MEEKGSEKLINGLRGGIPPLVSALLIAAAALAAMIGTWAASSSINRKGTERFAASSHDVSAEAPLMFTEEDIALIRELKGITAVEPDGGSAEAGSYKRVFVTVDGSEKSLFALSYRSRADAVMRRIEELGAVRAGERRAEVETELTGQREELRAGEAELHAEIAALDEEIAENGASVPEAERLLKETQALLDKTEAELEAARKRVSDAENELLNTRQSLDPDSAALEAEKASLEAEQLELSETRAGLVRSWNSLEDEKEGFRQSLRSAISGLGGEPEFIDWAAKRSARPDTADVRANELYVSPTYSFDLSQSLADNVRLLIYSGEIPDEDLLELTTSLGIYRGSDIDTARRMLSFGVGLAVSGYESEFKRIGGIASEWDAAHDEYSAALADYRTRKSSFDARLGEFRTGEVNYERLLDAYKNEYDNYSRVLNRRTELEADIAERQDILEGFNSAIERCETQKAADEAELKDKQLGIGLIESALEELPEGAWQLTDRRSDPEYAAALTKYEILSAAAVISACVLGLAAAAAAVLAVKEKEQREAEGA